MGSTAPTFDDVRTLIAKNHPTFEPGILAVFPWGSRIYQNTTATSDYDFIVVIEDGILPVPDVLVLKQFGSNAIDKRFIVLDEGLINCTLISYYDWRVCLLQHHHECLEVLFTDQNLYLFLSEKIRRLHSEFQIDLDLLRRTAAWESKRRYTRAVFPARDSMRRGKKDIVHALRYLLFAMQIFEHGRIIDFTCANDYYRQIVLGTEHVQTEEEFKALLIEWEPVRSELSHKLGEMRHSRRFYGRNDTEKLYLYDLRNRDMFYNHDLDSVPLLPTLPIPVRAPSDSAPLDIDDSFEVIHRTLSSDHPHLASLQDDNVPVVWLRSPESPNTLILSRQRVKRYPPTPFIKAISNGAVIQQDLTPNTEGKHGFRLLSLSLPLVPISKTISPEARVEWNRRLALPDASERYIAEEQLDGTHVTLFLHEGEWKLASRIEPLKPNMKLSYVAINHINYEITVNDAFWKVWKAKGFTMPSAETEGHLCFTFNLVYFEHRQMVRYDSDDAILVHIRDMRNGQVLDHRAYAQRVGWSLPRLFAGDNLPSSLESFETIVFNENPLLCKGYIIKPNLAKNDEPWTIVAIKNPIYVCMAYGTDSMRIGQLNMRVEVDRKMLLDMTLDGTSQRFVDFYPHWAPYFARVARIFYDMCDFVDAEYHKYWRGPRRDLVNGTANFELRHCVYNMCKNCYPNLAEFFSLSSTKGAFVSKPWRQYIKQHHAEDFDWLHGDDYPASNE